MSGKQESLYDSFYGYNPYEPYQVGKNQPITGATMSKKYINQIEEDIKRLTKEIKELESQTRLHERIKDLAGLPKNKAYRTLSDKERIDKIREQIKKAATLEQDMSAARKKVTSPGSSSKQTTTLPVINEVVRIDNVEMFTDQTHGTLVRFIDNDYYTEQVETKVVGMEQVDWWEYVLIYGIFKALKISFEYTKLKEMIERGMKSTRTVSGKLLEINFVPRKKFEASRTYDTLNGETVIRERGTKYESAILLIEVPQNKVRKTQEYKQGYFLYEDTFDTLELDYNKLLHNFDEIVAKYNIHESLKVEIKKNIISNGRLSGI